MSVSGKGGGMAAVCHGIRERWGELVSFHSDDVSHVLYSSKPSTLLLFLCASITVWTLKLVSISNRAYDLTLTSDNITLTSDNMIL